MDPPTPNLERASTSSQVEEAKDTFKNQTPELLVKNTAGPPIKKKSIYGLADADVLEGEQQCINAETIFTRSKSLNFRGRLIMTNYKLIFIPDNPQCCSRCKIPKSYLKVPLGLVSSYEKVIEKKPPMVYVDVQTKDERRLRFIFPPLEKDPIADKICSNIQAYAFPGEEKYSFAFSYKPFVCAEPYSCYNFVTEFSRMEVTSKGPFRVYEGNMEWKLCPSYPNQLVIPSVITDKEIEAAAGLWNLQRFPVLSYYHKSSGGSLWRSSSFKTGLAGLKEGPDKKLIQAITETASSVSTTGKFPDPQMEYAGLHIIDTRSKARRRLSDPKNDNAAAYIGTYEMNGYIVDDLTKLKESFGKYQQLCNDDKSVKSEKWFYFLDKTEWFYHIISIFDTTNLVLHSLKSGKAVLVHSGDGWDRVPLVISLALLLLDPYYRTIEGFEVLVEKEFVGFGHPFRTRLWNCMKNTLLEKEHVPIFLMFLDCVYQIMVQFPTAFEFNQDFLLKVATHVYTLRFGTFLCNNELERKVLGVRERTISLWRYLARNKEKYQNTLFDKDMKQPCINMQPMVVRMRVWEQLYMRWVIPSHKPPEDTEHLGKLIHNSRETIRENEAKRKEIEKQIAKCKEILQTRGISTSNP